MPAKAHGHKVYLLYFFAVKHFQLTRVFTIILLLVTSTIAAQNASRYWQQQVNYRIDVKLNDTTHSLDGEVEMEYINNSPDTLRFIWIHLWPNAYKNDRTAFAEQRLLERELDFYFSDANQKGYINRLNFSADGKPATLEDHPAYIDVAKLILPQPLLPGKSARLHTPFHVQLPELISRSGHKGQFYAIAQWFPKAAVYDQKGWHPMPYLSMGEFYADFGNYDVRITLPDNYAVAATGWLQNEEEIKWLQSRTQKIVTAKPAAKKTVPKAKSSVNADTPPSSKVMKTLHYKAEQVIDFAWAADKRFIVKYDTVVLASKQVAVWNFFLPDDENRWKNSMQFSKRALHFYSRQLGDYPYPQISVVASPGSEADGMEYPMFTLLNSKLEDPKWLDIITAHEIGHNWFQASIATNERTHAWMDEGMNTYIEQQYDNAFYGKPTAENKKISVDRISENIEASILQFFYSTRQDVPMESSADTVLPAIYYPIAYNKTADWMRLLEKKIGKEKMQALMKQYYTDWQFKHPAPEDFLQLAERVGNQPLQQQAALLHQTGPVTPWGKRQTALAGFFSLNNTDKKKYISLAPAIGYNNYDQFQIGAVIHNYNIPANPFQFVLTPMLGTGSKQPVGYGRFGYHWYPAGKKFYKAELYAGLAKFTTNQGLGEDGNNIPTGFFKFSPGVMLEWKKRNSLSTLQRILDFRTFIISEQQLKFSSPPPPGDTVFYAVRNGSATTIIPQLTMSWIDNRKLHPYSIVAGLQQVKDIVRLTFTGNYFLNYDKSGKGISARLFAGKIFYTQEKTTQLRSDNSRYHFTMHGPNGQQDYTYSNAFMERNQSVQIGGRQIMMRDGGFKYRSDFSSVVPGLSTTGADFFDDWMLTLNTYFDIPDKINPLTMLPFKTRLQLFADVGTSASPWKEGSTQPRFLYSIGFHLPVFKFLHLYYPVIQSSAFKEPNSVNDPYREGGPKWWQEKLTFSINFEDLKPQPGGFKLF